MRFQAESLTAAAPCSILFPTQIGNPHLTFIHAPLLMLISDGRRHRAASSGQDAFVRLLINPPPLKSEEPRPKTRVK